MSRSEIIELKCLKQLEILGYSFSENFVFNQTENEKCRNIDWIRDLLLSGGNEELSLDDITAFIKDKTKVANNQ